jgi:activator of 2-hydroxyglutaryl-CoA dehydratase
LVRDQQELDGFIARYSTSNKHENQASSSAVVVGCDFGSTTAKAVVLSPERELLFSCYTPSQGNPIEDAKGIVPTTAASRLRENCRPSR